MSEPLTDDVQGIGEFAPAVSELFFMVTENSGRRDGYMLLGTVFFICAI